MIIQCPNCSQLLVADDTDVDVQHECNSGNATLDQEDVLDVQNPNLNLAGLGSKAGGVSAATGVNIDAVTPRGNRASTHVQRAHTEFIPLK